MIGIDFNGQEDIGTPLIDFADRLLPAADRTNFFLHAGETSKILHTYLDNKKITKTYSNTNIKFTYLDWNGYSSDHNLFDAILLNSTRIGHGFSLYKHPVLLNLVKLRRICIEVCPISNQVLKLVTDMRNHPANFYVSQNLPIVIASDDPGFWNAKGLSYDFYYALMSMTPATTGLSFLKELVLNSIR